MPIPVEFPLVNPNEPEAILAELLVKEGQHVKAGDVLCIIETTKSTAELVADSEGYVVGLRASKGQNVTAGELLCFLSEDPSWQPPQQELPPAAVQINSVTGSLRISKTALELAQTMGVDFASLPQGVFITESIVREQASKLERGGKGSPVSFNPASIIVYGGGGHGKSCIDLLRSLRTYEIIGVIDDGLREVKSVMGLPVLGGGEVLDELYGQGVHLAVNAVGGIGEIAVRKRIFQRLEQAGFACPSIVHPTAYIEPSAHLASGVQIFPHAYIGSDVMVGFGVIVNTGAIVSHDCRLEEFVNISPGAILAGAVQVGKDSLVGMGATINLGVEIGLGARIGNGATVKSNVPVKGVVRAGSIYPE